LADLLENDEAAVELHQQFKFAVVSSLPDAEWTLTEEQVRRAIAAIRS
jgi:hypothetical protein